MKPQNEFEEIEIKALDSKVLAVARASIPVKEWAAYIGAVSGKKHSEEWREVADNGTKLPQFFAELFFPEFAKKYRWRE